MERDYPVAEYVIAVTCKDTPSATYIRAVLLAIGTAYALPDFLQLFCARVLSVLGNSDECRDDQDGRIIILRSFNLVKTWLSCYPDDFESPELLAMLYYFIRTGEILVPRIGQALETLYLRTRGPNENRSYWPAPIPCKFEEPITSLQSIPPVLLAMQLTWIEWQAFENFNPREVFYFWTDEAGTKAKSLVRIDKQSQYLTNLVNSEFIQLTKDTKRLEFVKYMWNVARECKKLQNINSLHTICEILDCLPGAGHLSEELALLQDTELLEIVDQVSYRNYRVHMRNLCPPALPIATVFLEDLKYSDTRVIEDDEICFSRTMNIYQLVTDFRIFCQNPFYLQEVPAIKNYILQHGSYE